MSAVSHRYISDDHYGVIKYIIPLKYDDDFQPRYLLNQGNEPGTAFRSTDYSLWSANTYIIHFNKAPRSANTAADRSITPYASSP